MSVNQLTKLLSCIWPPHLLTRPYTVCQPPTKHAHCTRALPCLPVSPILSLQKLRSICLCSPLFVESVITLHLLLIIIYMILILSELCEYRGSPSVIPYTLSHYYSAITTRQTTPCSPSPPPRRWLLLPLLPLLLAFLAVVVVLLAV